MSSTTRPKGVLLVNLGTPKSAHPNDVYRYLIEFLTDPNVIDTSWLKRQLLVRGLIVPLRYKTSAHAYQQIWTENGSPLLIYGQALQQALQEKLQSEQVHIELAMRYQEPSIKQALHRLRDLNVSEIFVLPLFPQYAFATTGSIHTAVMKHLNLWLEIPKIILLDSFPTYAPMISAFCQLIREKDYQEYDHLLFSFHGLPQRQLKKANRHGYCLSSKECCQQLTDKNAMCYSAQCHATAQAIAKELGIDQSQYSLSYQSRLGREPWLQPYTVEHIKELYQNGVRRLLVVCPSFVCDCLETLFEIGCELKHDFLKLGGEQLELVPGLNNHPDWIEAVKQLIRQELQIESYAASTVV